MTAFPDITVEVAFTTPPLSDSPVWEDISGYVELQEGLEVGPYGRQDEFDDTVPTQCQFTVDNSTGVFTPTNAASPFYPNVKDGRKIRIRAAWRGESLNTGGEFADGTTGWFTSSFGTGTFMWDTSRFRTGIASGRLTPSGSNSFPAVYTGDDLAGPVSVGGGYQATVWVYSVAGYGDVRIRIDWWNSSDAIISNTTPVTVNVPAGAWTRITTTGTAPASAVKGGVRIIMGGTPAVSDVLWIDDVELTAGEEVVYDRFTGYVNQWPVEWENGTEGRALGRVTATDRFKRVSTAGELLSALEQEVLVDEPEMYYVLNEDSESLAAGNTSGTTRPAAKVRTLGSGKIDFGSGEGPGFDDMSAPLWDAPHDDNDKVIHSAGSSSWLTVPLQPNVVFDSTTNGMTYEVWAKPAANTTRGSYRFCNAYDRVRVGVNTGTDTFGGASFGIDLQNNLYTFISDGVLAGTSLTYTGAEYLDDQLHHFVATYEPNTTNIRVRLYVDGVQVHTATYGSGTSSANCDTFHIGEDAYAVDGDGFLGSMSHVALYTYALSAGRIAAHYQAGSDGFTGDTSGERVERLAGYSDVPVSQTDLETGLTVFGPVAVRDQGPVEALQDVARTENGLVYINRTGELAFQGRDHRYNVASTLTLDATKHELGADATFMADDAYRRNDIYVTRSPGPALRRSDDNSVEEFGRYRDDMELLTSSDEEAIDAAEYRLAAYADPGPRISEFTVSLHEDPSRFPDILGIELGDKITVTNLPTSAPQPEVDLWIEGYTETVGVNEWRVTITTSPVLDGQDGLWNLGVSGASELGTTTVLGYGNTAPGLVHGEVPVPRTWVDTADWPSAAMMNVEIRDMVRWMLEPPAIKLFAGASGTQTISPSTSTDIIWNYEHHKNGIIHSTEADENPSWIILETPGVYLITCRIEFAAEAGAKSGRRDLQIVKNGTLPAIAQENMPQPADNTPSRASLSGMYEFAAGDRITVRVYQTANDASLNLNRDECEFACKWMAKV